MTEESKEQQRQRELLMVGGIPREPTAKFKKLNPK